VPETFANRLNKIGDEKLDAILDEFRTLDCQEHENKTLPEFCTYNKDYSFLKNLGLSDYTAYMFFDWINNNLYSPLGYKMYKKYTFPDIFNQLLNISKKNSMIHPEMNIPHYNDFLNNILSRFGKMEEKTSDFHKNKSSISDIAVEILKKFHIFWNVHR
jgi:hypothetical protein